MSLVDPDTLAAIRRRQAAETVVTPLSDPAAPDRHRHISHAAWRRGWTVGLTHLTRRIDVLRQRDDGVQVAASVMHRVLDLMSASVGAALDGEAQAPARITAWADEVSERTWKDMSDWNQRCLDEAGAELRAQVVAPLQQELDEARAELAALRAALSPAPEAPTMPTPAPLTALERAWRHVYPDTPAPSPADMLCALKKWTKTHHAPAMAQAAARRELMLGAA